MTTVLGMLKEKVTFVICASSDTRCFRHGDSNRNVKKSVIRVQASKHKWVTVFVCSCTYNMLQHLM